MYKKFHDYICLLCVSDCSIANGKDVGGGISLSRATVTSTGDSASVGGSDAAEACEGTDSAQTGGSPQADGSVVEASTPPCIRWATGLHSLLDDKDGVEHFQVFLPAYFFTKYFYGIVVIHCCFYLCIAVVFLRRSFDAVDLIHTFPRYE